MGMTSKPGRMSEKMRFTKGHVKKNAGNNPGKYNVSSWFGPAAGIGKGWPL